MAKNILGLDLGTNSIGWALIKQNFENKEGEILGMGSRIIPMTQDVMDKFGAGAPTNTQTAARTGYRGVRRLRERHLLRRERLHRVLHILGFLPKHYDNQIDFEKRFGKFMNQAEPKLSFNHEFLFKNSFNEMMVVFFENQPEFLINKKGEKALIPYDWTIYYLRKKALTQKIEKEELAWILLNFNQKRGYYQLRGEEEEENPNKWVKFHSLKIVDVVADEEVNKKGETWYSLHLENGWIYRRSSKISLADWKDKVRDFIVTTDLNDDGSEKLDKDGQIKRSFRAPGADDWTLLKKKTEQDIDQSHKTVGTYIYENLLLNPKQKIKGKLVRTIERKFYKDELNQILEKQKEFHPELRDELLLQSCARELYRNNEQHQQMLEAKDFVYLFLNDIIFYQRPLKSQKSSIGNCPLESRKSKEGVVYPIKVISKSNPYYQEFRLLQWLQNLVIYRNDDEANVMQEFLNSVESWESLFKFLNTKKEVKQDQLIKFLLEQTGLKGKTLTAEVLKYRWNYVSDKVYPMNETRYLIQSKLDKVENVPADFLSFENELKLWHIIYSVNDKIEYEKALKSFATKENLDINSFVESFKKFPPFKSDYGSFSEKAIKKLLPLIRFGTVWKYDSIDIKTKERIQKIINGEYDEKIKDRVREKSKNLTSENDFQRLPLWLAQYIAYNRHSEAAIAGKWNSVNDLENYLNEFKQHLLRNPIVEQVITETLRVVKDIWQQYGNGAKDFFTEIHVELGREMKNTADERKRLTTIVTDNENTNLRIKALLAEMASDIDVENVRPYSPMQQDILKIYEEGALNLFSENDLKTEILEGSTTSVFQVSKTAQPSSSDLKRYKLWLEQKYQSPYTGQMIPLNKLFTPEYEIEHIIPQSCYFDDSMSNKVICESAVNKLKDNQLGFEFIKNHHGATVDLGNGKTTRILEVEMYESFIKKNYDKNRGKRNKLLLEEIPEKMIERQLNDTRYISKEIFRLLSNIVRDEHSGAKDDGVNSKNLVPGNGKVTSKLKQDWGLNDVWNELILPRFERMNELTNSTAFTSKNTNGKLIPTVPLDLSKGFSKKRIDHRHHALDALVIALATRTHINYLNNKSAKVEDSKYEEKKKKQIEQRNILKNSLCFKTKPDEKGNYKWVFHKPWETITQDAHRALENIVVSFKQNLRVINKATNYYESYKDENGNLRLGKDGKPKKEIIAQKGVNWAIRKSLHEETVSGKVNLPWAQLRKGAFITATRKHLDTSYTIEKIRKITDTGIQKILENYLIAKENKPEIAFSLEGIEELNQNITLYNDGKHHQPILKFRVFEMGSGRFTVGEVESKRTKYVQGAPNLFYAVYENDDKRNFKTIPFNEVVEYQKQTSQLKDENNLIPIDNSLGNFVFSLSPLDLIYVPAKDELESNINFNNLNKEQRKRLYNVNDFSSTCYFSPNTLAKNIASKEVDLKLDEKKGKLTGSFDIKTASLDGIQIKEVCIKLNVDRLGNISKT